MPAQMHFLLSCVVILAFPSQKSGAATKKPTEPSPVEWQIKGTHAALRDPDHRVLLRSHKMRSRAHALSAIGEAAKAAVPDLHDALLNDTDPNCTLENMAVANPMNSAKAIGWST